MAGAGGRPRRVRATGARQAHRHPLPKTGAQDGARHRITTDAGVTYRVRSAGRLYISVGARRPAAAYRAALEPLGLRHRHFLPYGFRENTVGFHVFTRVRRHP